MLETGEEEDQSRDANNEMRQRWMDCANSMRAVRITEDEVHDRTGWRRIVPAIATPKQAAIRRRNVPDDDRVRNT